jgi:Cys-tRNA(Pro)/Cys-tRNA(Cys) deacylase
MIKTNVMRILDSFKIKYLEHTYDENIVDGIGVAQSINEDPNKVFKTLVTVGNDLKNYVFVIAVNKTLDMKKAAKSVGIKSISMLKQKDLFDLTGYVHGGCSPIGMKKNFMTVFDKSALNFDNIFFSGGKKGYQVEVSPNDISKVIRVSFEDLVLEEI